MTSAEHDLTEQIIRRILIPLGFRGEVSLPIRSKLDEAARKLDCERAKEHGKKLVLGLVGFLPAYERPFIVHSLLERFFERDLHIRLIKVNKN